MSEAARAVTWRHGTALMEAMWIIVVADVVMRLDNALAAVTHGHLILVVLGIAWSARLPLPIALGIGLAALGWWYLLAERTSEGWPVRARGGPGAPTLVNR
jgi:hypothetical protein